MNKAKLARLERRLAPCDDCRGRMDSAELWLDTLRDVNAPDAPAVLCDLGRCPACKTPRYVSFFALDKHERAEVIRFLTSTPDEVRAAMPRIVALHQKEENALCEFYGPDTWAQIVARVVSDEMAAKIARARELYAA